jgi:uncharacterized membrane protein
MTERQLFGVVVRAFALYIINEALWQIEGIVRIFGVREINNFDWQPAAVFAAIYLVAGLLMFRHAPAIVTLAYQAGKQAVDEDHD